MKGSLQPDQASVPGSAYAEECRLPGESFVGSGHLVLNPMPRRWKWDWKENVRAQFLVKFPIKFREASHRLAQHRGAAGLVNGQARLIPEHSIPYGPRPGWQAPNPNTGHEPVAQRFVEDADGNGTTDNDFGGTPVGQPRITFAEELDPADSGQTRAVAGLGGFLDLEIIKGNNGGAYIRWRSIRWQFDRFGNQRPYVDNVAREIENQDRRIRE